MNAIVSGSANVAILVEGDKLWSLRRTPSGVERLSREPRDIRYLLGDARDLAFLEDVDDAAVLTELDLAHTGVVALHLSLMLCDPTTSEKATRLAAEELDEHLARPEVSERVERILDAKPMPSSFSIDTALARCQGHARAVGFFGALAARQPTIREVRRAWDVLPGSLFESGEDRLAADGTLAREGLFRSLVRARIANASIDVWLAEARRNPAVMRVHGERWLGAWVELFRRPGLVRDAESDVDPELAELLAILSTQGEVEAAERLRRIDLGRRDRFFDAIYRAIREKTEAAFKLAEALLRIVGGLGNIGRVQDPPTAEDQRWAGRAARRLAPSSMEIAAQCDRLVVPAMPVRKTKAPAWAPGGRAAA